MPADAHASPAVAPTLNANPTLHANIGSISNSTMTARDKTIRAFAGEFNTALLATMPAINAARRTEGSPRVRATNHTSSNIVRIHFSKFPRRLNNGDAMMSKYATFCPDTAHR
jgi:hypothetical protein